MNQGTASPDDIAQGAVVPAEDGVSSVARRRSPRGDAARARILEVARGIFAERGYRGSSINEIAKAAGLSMPGLVHHFPGKDALFAAVLREHDVQDTEYFDHELLTAAGGLANAGVFDVLDAYVATARINRARRSFVQLSHLNAAESASGDHPGTEVSVAHFRKARGFVTDALRRSIARGEARDDVDVDVVAAQVVGMIEGLENQWLHEGDSFDFAGIFADFIADLTARLRP